MVLFGFGETTVVAHRLPVRGLDHRARRPRRNARHCAFAGGDGASYGATPWQAFRANLPAGPPCRKSSPASGWAWSARVKGVIIGQLLVSVIGFGYLFEIYSSNFLMEHLWALLLVLFLFAFLLDSVLGRLEKRIEYYSAARG